MKNKIELDIGIGTIIAEPNTKNKEQIFYRFIPTDSFNFKVSQVLFTIAKDQKSIEEQLEKKLMKIYHE